MFEEINIYMNTDVCVLVDSDIATATSLTGRGAWATVVDLSWELVHLGCAHTLLYCGEVYVFFLVSIAWPPLRCFRVAQGLLGLKPVCAHVLPAEVFGLTELATPPWGGAAAGQLQCRQESLEFLLDGREDATSSDMATLKADTQLVNETLCILRASN